MFDPTKTLGPTDPPVKLTPEQAVAALRTLRDQLPLPDGSEIPVSSRRRLAHVNAEFAAAAVNAAGVHDAVQTAVGRTDDQMRQEMDAATRWTQFTDELRSLLATSKQADTVRRQRIGLAALQTYKICVQIARDDKNAARLAPHIAEMKRLNRFGRSRKSQKQPQVPTPVPAPAPEHQ
jgi:hypothetical protein